MSLQEKGRGRFETYEEGWVMMEAETGGRQPHARNPWSHQK